MCGVDLETAFNRQRIRCERWRPDSKEQALLLWILRGHSRSLPLVSQITLPTPTYQQYVLDQLAVGGTDTVTGTSLLAQAAEIPFY
jgi:hypothetical protein